MAQTVLPFQYEVEKSSGEDDGVGRASDLPGIGAPAGASAFDLDHVQARTGNQGWTDDRMIMALALLNMARDDWVDEGGSGWRKASILSLRGQCRMAADHDCRVQRQFSHEAPGFGELVRGRLKVIRFRLIRLPGRVLEHGWRLIVRLAGGIRRTSWSLKHEGGWHSCAIRADVSPRGEEIGAWRGLRRAGGIARSKPGPNQGATHTLAEGAAPAPVFEVHLLPSTGYLALSRGHTGTAAKADRGFWTGPILDKGSWTR